MVALVATVADLGLEARAVEVQCQIAPGLPKFHVVGLPDKPVNENRQRVPEAFSAMGLSLPPKIITINLSPADLLIAILAAMGVTDAELLADYVAVGELALGERLPVVAAPDLISRLNHLKGHQAEPPGCSPDPVQVKDLEVA